MSGFAGFDTIDDLPHVLQHLGPITGGDLLVFRGGDFTEAQRDEITEAVLHYYVELARARTELHVKTTSGETKYTINRDEPAVAHVPLLVFLPDGADLEHLDESDMIRAGWARTPKQDAS